MPTLPALTVTDVQAARLLAAFPPTTDSEGAPVTSVQAYRQWLRKTLVEYVKGVESAVLRDQQAQVVAVALAEADVALTIGV